jgi:hypothetical protein
MSFRNKKKAIDGPSARPDPWGLVSDRNEKRSRRKEEEKAKADLPLPLNVWGLAGFILGALGLLAASLVGIWIVTVALSALGVGAVAWGWVATRHDRQPKDRVWLNLGGGMSGVVLLITLFLPGLLNDLWPVDVPVAAADANKLELVERDTPDERKPLGADDWANAATQAIRQDDALVRLESVKAGAVPGKNSAQYLQIHFRLANVGRKQDFTFEGFDKDARLPVLKDNSGRSFTFVEQRPRVTARGEPKFVEPNSQPVPVTATQKAEYLLVFELPPTGPYLLELPAAAWGRTGVCRFRIESSFDSTNRK